jgi:hypothetical protein
MSPMYLQPAFLPDGRTVVAGYHETFGWTLRLGDTATDGPDLRVLLQAALEDHPDWVRHVHDELAGRDIGSARRWPCACCGCFTLEEAGRSSHQICPVCFWEDDGHQFRHPASTGGANRVSLEQAVSNYRLHGVSEPSFSDHVRPTPEEEP